MTTKRDNHELETEALLAQRSSLEALARRLLADAHGAEDVVQDACVAALESPPHDAGRLGAWLKSVVRNRVANLRREASARAQRELDHAPTDPTPSAGEIVTRLQTQRHLYAALLKLPEAYRQALFLRFGKSYLRVRLRDAWAFQSRRCAVECGVDSSACGWTSTTRMAGVEPGSSRSRRCSSAHQRDRLRFRWSLRSRLHARSDSHSRSVRSHTRRSGPNLL